jgi:hypothetical protein
LKGCGYKSSKLLDKNRINKRNREERLQKRTIGKTKLLDKRKKGLLEKTYHSFKDLPQNNCSKYQKAHSKTVEA